jgi:DNA (cytosine-5)-methyltransferase 1
LKSEGRKVDRKLTVGSCFSGIGGLEKGLEDSGGFETRWQIEFDEYASAVLAKHWPRVQRYSDIRDVVQPERVDVICGGFPCQDVSLAGARKGLEGKRSTLWSEMFRLICEVKPQWVVAENVPGLLSSDNGQFFGNILRDLAGAGYDAEWGVLSAAGVGAPHLRRRIFILAHSMPSRERGKQRESEDEENDAPHTRLLGSTEYEKQTTGIEQLCEDVANSTGERFVHRANIDGKERKEIGRNITCECGETFIYDPKEKWGTEPSVCRMAYGVSNRSHRLKCLGNAVVPAVAQKIGEMILNSYKLQEI